MHKVPRYLLAPILAVGLATTAQAAGVTATDYVAKAGASDLYEQQSSKLVLASTQNPQVRQFAQMMVSDHAKTTADVKAAATAAKMTPKPPALDAAKTEMIRALTAAKGTTRDSLYLRQQATAHQEALMLHQNYAQSGDQPQLKAVAAKAVPIVQHHIDTLRGITAS